MDTYDIYKDYSSYLKENEELITKLQQSNSLLTEYIDPIIKALGYLQTQKEYHAEEYTAEDEAIFSAGFNCLFENLEQIKLYLHALNDDYSLLDRHSYYIKLIFDLEEIKVELEKLDEQPLNDIKKIAKSLEFFEQLISPQSSEIDEDELGKHLKIWESMQKKYDFIIPLTVAFNEYCESVGI